MAAMGHEHHGNGIIGQQGVGVQHADDRCCGFLHATVDRRRPATTSSPAASAMATDASPLPPSTASTSAGGGSSAASERNSRGSPAASFSMGMTMATPVIAFGSLQRPGPARQIVRTVEVGETFQRGGNDLPPTAIRTGSFI